MKDESQMIAAFDAIGDPRKKAAVIEKLSASNEKICEMLLEKNPELKVELDKPKENGDRKTIKGFVKGLFREAQAVKEPEILKYREAEREKIAAAKEERAEQEAVKVQETSDQKQPSPLRTMIKGMLAKIKDQIIEIQKVNEAIKEGRHRDAERHRDAKSTAFEIGG